MKIELINFITPGGSRNFLDLPGKLSPLTIYTNISASWTE